jgi:polysaccharide chain length determinant protein (PEP-CTERM system associated)
MLPGKSYTPADYAAMAFRWRWVIIAPFLVGGYLALIVSSRMIDTYDSDMLIQVVPQRIPSSFVQSTVQMRTVDRLSALTEQIMSRTELERLITELDLYKEERARLPMQDVVERMRSQLRVDPVIKGYGLDRDADSFYVRFSYPDPVMSRRVTERLGSLFINVNAQDRGELAQATQAFLESALAESKDQLEKTEARLRGFREKNAGRLPTELAYNMQAMQNAQIRVQGLVESMARDRDRRLILDQTYKDVQAEIDATPAVSQTARTGDPDVPAGTTSQQLAVAKQTLVGFELRLKPEHPDVVRTKGLIAKLEAQLAAETKAAEEARLTAGEEAVEPVAADPREVARRARLRQLALEIENLDRDIARKERDEQTIRQSLEDVQRRIEQVPGLESEWIALTRDYDTQFGKYKELLNKSENAQLASSLEERQIGEQFKILDPARTPSRPSGAIRLQVNAIGAGIGLAVGLLLAAFLELRDRTFRLAHDIVEVLKLPVIALVPEVISAADQQRNRMRKGLAVATAWALVVAGGYGFWTMQLWKYVV